MFRLYTRYALLSTTLFCVGVSLANEPLLISALSSTRFSVSAESVPLKRLLDELSQQSGVDIANQDERNAGRLVSIHIDNQTVDGIVARLVDNSFAVHQQRAEKNVLQAVVVLPEGQEGLRLMQQGAVKGVTVEYNAELEQFDFEIDPKAFMAQ